MVNKIKTLKNLNKEFPRFQLETLLKIMDCIEEEIQLFPINTSATTNNPLNPPFEPYCSTTDSIDESDEKSSAISCSKINSNIEVPTATYTGYCSMSETDTEGNTYKVTATNDNGKEEYHAYVNDEEVGVEFPPKSKKQPHLCDKTSHKVNILTDREKKTIDDFIDDTFHKYL